MEIEPRRPHGAADRAAGLTPLGELRNFVSSPVFLG
jgi:hypothetical protein